jgi:disulfide bond formation protein DsbB
MKNPYFMQKITTKMLVVLAGASSAAFLAFALISQYGFHLHPCELCLAQRVPYALIVLVAILSCLCFSSERAMKKSELL